MTRLWQQTADGLPQNFVAAMAQTSDGYLWLATQEGVARFDGARFVVFTSKDVPELGTNDIDAFAEDASGGLWIGTRGAGITHYASGAFKGYSHKDGLAHDIVLALLEARDGTLWIGTRGGGVSRWKDGHFTTYRAADGLVSDTVTSIAEGPDGSVWFGTDGGGVSRYQAGHFTTVKGGLTDPSVQRAPRRRGRHALDRDARRPRPLATRKDGVDDPARASPARVHALLRDDARKGSLWIAAREGIRRLSPGGHDALEPTSSTTPFGTLTKLDTDGVHHLEAASLLEDPRRNLWAGTESIGLVQLQDGKVTTFGSEFVWTTFVDGQGTLWLHGGDPGVFTLQGDQLVPAARHGDGERHRHGARPRRFDLVRDHVARSLLVRPRQDEPRRRRLVPGRGERPLALHRFARRPLVRDQLRSLPLRRRQGHPLPRGRPRHPADAAIRAFAEGARRDIDVGRDEARRARALREGREVRAP